MNPLEEQWNGFARAVIPADAPKVQRREMKRAFYAGAEAMMRIQYAIGSESVTEAEAIKTLEACQKEAHEFAHQVAIGKS